MFSVVDRYAVNLVIISLAAICMLNLNGVGVMLIGINQLFSPLLLLSSFILIIIGLLKGITLSKECLLYIVALVSYMLIGGLTALLNDGEKASLVMSLLFRYFTAIIVTLAAYYSVFIAISVKLSPLKVLLIFCTLASAFIPFGEVLNISGRIVVDSQRGAGLFGNPNEAGIIAVMGFAATLVFLKNKSVKVSISIFLIAMAVLTFSKAVSFMIILVYFSNLLFKGRMSTNVIRLLLSVVVIYSLLISFRTEIINQFEGGQARRIDQFFSILMLEPSEDSVKSSRGYLWEKGMEHIARSPIIGNGLGALHSMEGANAAVNGGHAQGVHNSYLLKFGDAGIIAFTLFILFILLVTYQSFKIAKFHPYARISFFYFLIFILDCMVTHNVELLRFHNYLIGSSLALLYISKHSQMRRE